MTTLSLNSATSTLAIALIDAYRTWVSPYKGFRCAYGARGGKVTCSCFGLRVFKRTTPLKALGVLKKRLDLCRLAYEEHKEKKRRKREERRAAVTNTASDMAEGMCDGIDLCANVPDPSGCDGAGDACGAIGSCS